MITSGTARRVVPNAAFRGVRPTEEAQEIPVGLDASCWRPTLHALRRRSTLLPFRLHCFERTICTSRIQIIIALSDESVAC